MCSHCKGLGLGKPKVKTPEGFNTPPKFRLGVGVKPLVDIISTGPNPFPPPGGGKGEDDREPLNKKFAKLFAEAE